MSRRNWFPCRVCGKSHTNPMSSSICSPCGQSERDERVRQELMEQEEYESSAFGQFMMLSEEDRWREIFDRLEALDNATT